MPRCRSRSPSAPAPAAGELAGHCLHHHRVRARRRHAGVREADPQGTSDRVRGRDEARLRGSASSPARPTPPEPVVAPPRMVVRPSAPRSADRTQTLRLTSSVPPVVSPETPTGVNRYTRSASRDARSTSPARSASRTSSSLYASSRDRYGAQLRASSKISTLTSAANAPQRTNLRTDLTLTSASCATSGPIARGRVCMP